MNARQRRNFQTVAALIIVAMVGLLIFQYATTTAFNNELHVSKGAGTGEDCAADIQPRGDNTSSWYKQDTGLTGQIYDATVLNNTPYLVNTWSMTINIKDPCYLNQFWNGDVEIHQHTSSGTTNVQKLNLASYSEDSLQLDYQIDGSDLLIPLSPGDSIVYYPSKEFSEMPLRSSGQTIVGMIFYFNDSVNLTDYQVDYYFYRDFTEGPAFYLLIALGVLLAFTLATYFIVKQTYRQAQNELELRKSGLSCMSEIYAVIYLIDLVEDTITPVGVDDNDDKLRPKDLSPNDQLKHLFEKDAKPEYVELALKFSDLDTIAERLADRNSNVFEYESSVYGWCRIRFIAMDRSKTGTLEKVLFTVEQINQEKQELSSVLMQVEQAKSESEKRGALMEQATNELWALFDDIFHANELIRRESGDENVRRYADVMHAKGMSLRSQVRNTVDYINIHLGKVTITPIAYSLKGMILSARNHALNTVQNENISFELAATQTLPDQLRGDELKLEQVIFNMLVEAAHIQGAGKVKLNVFGKVVDDQTVHLLVSILASHGDGQQDGAAPASAAGIENDDATPTSIGMGLAQSTLELMGSNLSVVEAYEGGTNLYFEIDQQIVNATPIGPLEESAQEGALA